MKKTITNIALNSLYQLFLIAMPVVTIPYLSRTLGVYYVGEYSYLSSIVTFFSVIIILGLNQLGAKIIAETPFKKRRYEFSSIWTIQIIMGIITSSLYLLFLTLSSSRTGNYLLLFFPYLLSYIFDISWFYIGIADIKKVTLRNIIVKTATIIVIFSVVHSKSDFNMYILINSIGMFLSNIVFFVSLGHSLPPKIQNVKFKFHINRIYLKNAFILFVPLFAAQVYTSLDKTIVGGLAGTNQLAFYDQSQKIARILLSLLTSLSIVLMPKMVEHRENKERTNFILKKSLDYTFILSLLFSVLVFVNADNFVPWFFGTDFSSMIINMKISAVIIVFISYGGVFSSQFAVAEGLYKQFAIPYVLGALINMTLNLIFVGYFKSLGATIISVVTELIVCMLRVVLVKDNVNFGFLVHGQFIYLLSACLGLVGGTLVRVDLGNIIIDMIVRTVIVITLFLLPILFMKSPIKTDIKLLKNTLLSHRNS